jgi:hypothetical protein
VVCSVKRTPAYQLIQSDGCTVWKGKLPISSISTTRKTAAQRVVSSVKRTSSKSRAG